MAGMQFDPASLIQNLLAVQQQSSQQVQQAVEGITASFDKSNQLSQQAQEKQKQAVDQAALNAAAKVEVDYAQNKMLEGLQQTFNMDPAAADNEIRKSLAVVDQARGQYDVARAEYDKLASTDLMSNPIGFLLAQIKLPSAAAKVNALADVEDRALQNINTRTAQLTATKNVLTANTADQVRQNQLKQTEVDKALAEAKLTQQEAANAAALGAQQMQIINLRSKGLDDVRSTILGVSNLMARQEALVAANEAREDRAVDRRLRQEQLQLMLDEKRANQEEEARTNMRLEAVSKSLGLVEPMTVKKLRTLTNKREQMIWLEASQTGQLGPDLKTSLEFYLGKGNRSVIQQTGGASVYDTAKKLESGALAFEGEATRGLMTTNMGRPPKREDALAKAFEIYEATAVAATNGTGQKDLSSSQWDQTYNPYKAPFLSFNRAVDTKPELASLKNNIVKTTIDDLVKSGAVTGPDLTASQQQQVLGGIVEKVNARQLTPKQAAAQVAVYFGNAVQYNSDMNHPEQFGLPPQATYAFTIRPAAFSGGEPKQVDLLNPVAVENAISAQVAQRARSRNYDPTGAIGKLYE